MDSRSSNSTNLAPYQAPPVSGALASPLPPLPTPPAGKEEPSLRDYWHILLRRRWTIMAVVVITLTVVTIVTLRMRPLYESTGRIAVYREAQENLGFKNAQAQDTGDAEYTVVLETQVQVLKSRALAVEVARKLLKASTNATVAETATRERGINSNTAPANPAEAALVGELESHLQVAIVPRTQIIEIRFRDADPNRAAQVVRTYTQTYIENNFQTKLQSIGQTTDWLTNQLSDLQLKVEISQEKLVRYQKEHGILGGDEKQNIITTRLDDLNKSLTEAEKDRIDKQVNFQLASQGDSEVIAKLEQGTLLGRLRSQQADLRERLRQYSVQFGPSYPKVAEAKAQLETVEAGIAVEQKKLMERLRNDYLNASQREKMLRDTFERQKSEANQLNESAIQYSLLKRDVDTNRQLYEGLLQRLKEAGVVAGLKSSNINVVDSASLPKFPVEPNVPRNVMIGLLVGLFGGIGLAFVLELMDSTVVTTEDVQNIAMMPLLGIIPSTRLPAAKAGASQLQRRLLPPRPLISMAKSNSQIAESFRALRTSLLLSCTTPKIILVTSAVPQEGKTTTCVNIATTLAQKGARVLLVDADLRRPSIHKTVSATAGGGLSTVLSGMDKLEDVIAHLDNFPNISFLFAGPVPPQPAELLDSEVMRNCLATWSQEYDHVVIDTPPVLTVTDAVLLSVRADTVVLVVRSGVTKKEAVRRARELLVQVRARITGVVLNDVDTQAPYYYYYNHKYDGYYDQEH